MAAPSGKFWIPMPRARAIEAGSRVMSAWAARAKEMPTAIPSGMLCMVMASTSRVFRRPRSPDPRSRSSGVRWGSRTSIPARKAMPRTEPPAAGSQPVPPAACDCSMAGIRSDHILAAIITPAAKPSMIRCSPALAVRRKRKTVAAPRAVIKKVKPLPPAAHRSACVNMRFLSRRGGGLLSPPIWEEGEKRPETFRSAPL